MTDLLDPTIDLNLDSRSCVVLKMFIKLHSCKDEITNFIHLFLLCELFILWVFRLVRAGNIYKNNSY